jgi:hypothetical protein
MYTDAFKNTAKQTTCILANCMKNVHFFQAFHLSTSNVLSPVLR